MLCSYYNEKITICKTADDREIYHNSSSYKEIEEARHTICSEINGNNSCLIKINKHPHDFKMII